jgi:hypothetical protein
VFEITCVRVTMLKENEAGHSKEFLRAWDMNATVPPGTVRGFSRRNTMNRGVLLPVKGVVCC